MNYAKNPSNKLLTKNILIPYAEGESKGSSNLSPYTT